MCEGEIKIIKKKQHYKEIKLYKQLSLEIHETKLTEERNRQFINRQRPSKITVSFLCL